MRNVLNSYGRALLSQLHGKILLLSAVPFVLSVILWGVLLYVGLQPLIDSLHALFTSTISSARAARCWPPSAWAC
jgi:hypothetical protein